ncbi:MAG: hypothetical protein P8Z76_12595 [Alphaproteobacteria bacterium]
MLPLDGLPWAQFDVLAASFTLNLLALVMPIVILQTYDRIVPNNSYETLLLLVVFVAGALVLDAFFASGTDLRDRLGRGAFRASVGLFDGPPAALLRPRLLRALRRGRSPRSHDGD